MIRIQDESQSLIPMVLIFWVCEKNAKIECEIEFVSCFKKRMKRAERTSFTAPASLGTHGSMMGMFMRVVIHPQQNRIERFDNLLAPKKYLLNTKKKKKNFCQLPLHVKRMATHFLLDGCLHRSGDTSRRSSS